MADTGKLARYVTLVIVIGLAASLAGLSGSLFETVKSGEVHVKQAAITGEITCHTVPGTYVQLFGDVFRYPMSETYWFGRSRGEHAGDMLTVRFSDGAKAEIHGSVQVMLPTSCDALMKIHSIYRGFDNLMERLVKQAVQDSIYNTGPFMTSAESYAERRAEFAALASEQLIQGIYLTDYEEEQYKDPLTGEMQRRTVMKRRIGADGKPLTKIPVFSEYSIKVEQFVIKHIEYPETVLEQIERQQKARMAVLTAMAESKKAQQDTLTIVEQGKAKVAQAEADEKVEKARAVVQAQKEKEVAELGAAQRLKVAELDRQTAEQQMQAAILRAKGDEEAARRRLSADGALALKLETLKSIHELWAAAYAKQRPTPDIVLGGAAGGATGAQDLMNLLTAKTAQELRVNLGASK